MTALERQMAAEVTVIDTIADIDGNQVEVRADCRSVAVSGGCRFAIDDKEQALRFSEAVRIAFIVAHDYPPEISDEKEG